MISSKATNAKLSKTAIELLKNGSTPKITWSFSVDEALENAECDSYHNEDTNQMTRTLDANLQIGCSICIGEEESTFFRRFGICLEVTNQHEQSLGFLLLNEWQWNEHTDDFEEIELDAFDLVQQKFPTLLIPTGEIASSHDTTKLVNHMKNELNFSFLSENDLHIKNEIMTAINKQEPSISYALDADEWLDSFRDSPDSFVEDGITYVHGISHLQKKLSFDSVEILIYTLNGISVSEKTVTLCPTDVVFYDVKIGDDELFCINKQIIHDVLDQLNESNSLHDIAPDNDLLGSSLKLGLLEHFDVKPSNLMPTLLSKVS